MYGVIIEKGPSNWQIIQQHSGFAEISLSGSCFLDDETNAASDKKVIIRAVDENTNTRVCEPVFCDVCNNKWQGSLVLKAGGPYRIEAYLRFNGVCEKRGDRRFHIGVGDLYVIAGQSNAVGVGKDSVCDNVSPSVSMFRLRGSWDMATHPLHDSTDTKYPLNQETAQTGHSPWLNFAKILSNTLGYPIGLIPATKGGVPLSVWDKAEDGSFFDNMLKIVSDAANGDIKGILWSQGCNDASNIKTATSYLERFKRVAKDFEAAFYKNIPILTVQLNKVVCTKTSDTATMAKNYSILREAQRRAAKECENVFITPSIDLMVCDGIHNSAPSNMVIGARVANIALRYIYDMQNIICDAPDIKAAVINGKNSVRLSFNNMYDSIWSDNNQTEALFFSLTDKIGRMLPCDYSCEGQQLVLSFEREINGSATLSCDKYNDTGLVPYDLFSYLPIVPFDNIEVQSDEK